MFVIAVNIDQALSHPPPRPPSSPTPRETTATTTESAESTNESDKTHSPAADAQYDADGEPHPVAATVGYWTQLVLSRVRTGAIVYVATKSDRCAPEMHAQYVDLIRSTAEATIAKWAYNTERLVCAQSV